MMTLAIASAAPAKIAAAATSETPSTVGRAIRASRVSRWIVDGAAAAPARTVAARESSVRGAWVAPFGTTMSTGVGAVSNGASAAESSSIDA